ncbi:hypothetical protein DAEQUDRAFT_723977 [Daedalea quercina L-15889]|uniref:Uncharacterized protein n=1 Tax=Daedalea quercina L-15889 TaxID=1314783 RepID=A0A165S311_9APHY|nr:hypothetical protein DAEQUDRAFT_723977 [Daedalea quercina L-15889]
MSAGENIANAVPVSGGPVANNLTAPSSAGASSELHSRVVEMLAATLNSGFAEIGYHPDHLAHVQSTYEWNTRLRDENARLFSDNQRLAQLIGMQNTRIVSSAPSGGNNATTHELQSRIQELEMSRQEVVRQNEQL